MTSWQAWGVVLLAPYVLVFLAFVLYPVSYGLWLARHPESYVRLFDDPIFFRTVINTIVFLVVAVGQTFVLTIAGIERSVASYLRSAVTTKVARAMATTKSGTGSNRQASPSITRPSARPTWCVPTMATGRGSHSSRPGSAPFPM